MNEPFEALKLDHQLCFPLYAVSKEVVKKYKPFLDELDLTYTQYITMMVLWEEQDITVKALGARLFLDSGTMTPVLNALEKKGFAARRRDDRDRRDVYVSVTDKGMALRERAVDIPARLGACIPLDPEDAAMLYTILRKMMKNL